MKFEDSATHRRKAKWHAERAGTGMPAKIAKVGQHTYRAGLEDEHVGHYHKDHPDYDHDPSDDTDFAFTPR